MKRERKWNKQLGREKDNNNKKIREKKESEGRIKMVGRR